LYSLDSDSLSSASVSASLRHSARVRSASLGILRVRSNPNQPIRMKSARRRTHSSYHDNTQPALIKSLFPNVPPYINFVTENERGKLYQRIICIIRYIHCVNSVLYTCRKFSLWLFDKIKNFIISFVDYLPIVALDSLITN